MFWACTALGQYKCRWITPPLLTVHGEWFHKAGVRSVGGRAVGTSSVCCSREAHLNVTTLNTLCIHAQTTHTLIFPLDFQTQVTDDFRKCMVNCQGCGFFLCEWDALDGKQWSICWREETMDRCNYPHSVSRDFHTQDFQTTKQNQASPQRSPRKETILWICTYI